MKRTRILIILVLFCVTTSVNGQTYATLDTGEELRISIRDIQLRLDLKVSHKPILAQYISSSDGMLYVYYRNDYIKLPLSAISLIERRTDKLRGNAGFGAIAGGFIGVIIVGISQSTENGRDSESTSNELELISSSDLTLITVGGGVAIGAILGSAIRSPVWEKVDLSVLK